MIKKHIQIASAVVLFYMTTFPIYAENTCIPGDIKRLTHSGNNVVQYPCLSDDGRWMLYVMEIKENEKTIKALKIMNIEDGEERELFSDGKRKALDPFEDISLLIGSKPPLLSGNGRVAVFTLSLDEPANILDHYLGIINTDSTDLNIIHFPIETLKRKNHKSLDFTSSDWERISNYAVSSDGARIACILKGHLGPRRYGNPSGMVFYDTSNKKQRTIIAPDFNGNGWVWSSMPCSPLTGGGWAFCMSGNGQKVVFGAQSSTDKTDYDLYTVNWDGKEIKQITNFHDRWFSLADISRDGEKVVFFYTGKKKHGIGTYTVKNDGSDLKYLESKVTPRIDFYDMSGNGRYILFKHIYRGMILDLHTDQERVAFDEATPGYSKGLIPMDFPCTPAFWGPRIMSLKGDRVLLIGPPQGKEAPEIYLLSLDIK